MRIGLLILLSLAMAFAPSASALACGEDYAVTGGAGIENGCHAAASDGDADTARADTAMAHTAMAEISMDGDCCCIEEAPACTCSTCLEEAETSNDRAPSGHDSNEPGARQDCLCGHKVPQNNSPAANEAVVVTLRLALSTVAERSGCPTYREMKQSRPTDGSNPHPEVRLPLLL